MDGRQEFSGLPNHAKHSFEQYWQFGILPHPFLEAVLANDLNIAVSLADKEEFRLLPKYISASFAIPKSRGSKAIVHEWIEQGGAQGIEFEVENVRDINVRKQL